MKFTTNQPDFNRAMQFVASAIDGKSPLPVMNNVLIQAKGEQVTISGTDSEIEKRITINAMIDVEGETTAPAKKLLDFAKNADQSKDVKFEQNESKAFIKSGRAKWSLNTLPAKEYPEFMSVDESLSIDCDVTVLIDAIKRCSPTMAVNDVRYYLNGMLFDVEGNSMTIVATDGHRMSCYSLPVQSDTTRSIIVPRSSVSDILKMIGKSTDANIIVGKDNIKVTVGEMVMYSKLIDGKFPDYRRVIPQDLPVSVAMNAEELRGAVKRTMPITNQYNAMIFGFSNGSLSISATNEQAENASEMISANISGPDIEIGFNGSYVSDTLSTVTGDNVTIQLRDSGASARVDEGSYTSVLMPIRV